MRFRRFRSPRRRVFYILLSIFLLGALSLVLLDLRFRPLIDKSATQLLTNAATSIINSAVGRELSRDSTSYDQLVEFEKDDGGHITALKTNMVKINSLKTQILDSVLRELEQLDRETLSLPLGNLSGLDFLSGRGPLIPISVVPLATSKAEFTNRFTAAGINQTRHQIMLEVAIDVRILTPRSAVETTVSAQVPVAETVIVGNIPGNYTYFQDGNSLSSTEKSGILYGD